MRLTFPFKLFKRFNCFRDLTGHTNIQNTFNLLLYNISMNNIISFINYKKSKIKSWGLPHFLQFQFSSFISNRIKQQKYTTVKSIIFLNIKKFINFYMKDKFYSMFSNVLQTIFHENWNGNNTIITFLLVRAFGPSGVTKLDFNLILFHLNIRRKLS